MVPRFLALVLFLLVLGSGPAEARPKTDRKLAREARKHLKLGLKHAARGKHDKAIEALQVSYSLDPVPAVLFHIAEAHNARKEYKEALYYYRQYEKEEPKGARRRGVAAIIDALAAMEGEATAATPTEPPPPAEPAPAPPPEPAPAPVAAPAPAADLTAPAPAEEAGGGGLRLSAYIAGGAGLALLGAGGYYAWVAGQRSDELSELFAEEGQWSPAYQETWDEGESARTRAIWLGAAGGAAVAAGVVLYLLGRPERSSVEVGAAPAAGGGEVMARWTF